MFTKPTLPTTHQPSSPRPRSVDHEKAQLHRQVRRLTSEVTGLEEQLQAMRQSTSWRFSAPLRWLSRQLGRKPAPGPAPSRSDQSYAEWIRLYDSPPPGMPDPFCVRRTGQVVRPSLSIVLAASTDQVPLLAASIDAILAQDPHAELFHHESATRGSDASSAKRQRFDREQDYMRSKWPELIADDPAYNPNLTAHAEDFGLAWPPRVPWIAGAAAP